MNEAWLARLTKAIAEAYGAKSLDWHALVATMTDVQKMVHLAARKTIDDEAQMRAILLKESRTQFETGIRQEIIGLGCGDPGKVYLREGAELTEISQRADMASKSIANTYNYELAREIIRIADEVPRANRHTYAYRLATWNQNYTERRSEMIAQTEAGWAHNEAKRAFWEHNRDVAAQAEVVPAPTVCPVCAGYVANNPYRSMEDLYRRCELPAHPRCPHHGQPIIERGLTPNECRLLWRG